MTQEMNMSLDIAKKKQKKKKSWRKTVKSVNVNNWKQIMLACLASPANSTSLQQKTAKENI